MNSLLEVLQTDRLILRTWQEQDLELLYQINQDPRVMEFFPHMPDRVETQRFFDKVKEHQEQYGYSLYAVDRKDSSEFIGFVGLLVADFSAHFTPAAEIAWRLGYEHWGQGFATEAARAVLKYGFEQLSLPEIVSFTAVINARSRRVMEKIGLQYDPKDDFDHPKLDKASPLLHHVLYRLRQVEFLSDE